MSSYTSGLSGLKLSLREDKVKISNPNKSSTQNIGRVYAIIIDENTPSPDIFQSFGGWDALGTIFYLNYNRRENFSDAEIITKIKDNYFEVARPSDFNNKFYPLIGELVNINDMPSPLTPLSKDLNLKYYTRVINYWNNSHQNADIVLSNTGSLGNFIIRNDIRPLMPFSGDYIMEGRNGASIRLGVSTNNTSSWWGNNSSNPITIISNGHGSNPKSLTPYIENVNNDASSIILTTNQVIPINILKTTLNPITKPQALNVYSGSQAMVVGDRVSLVAKKENIMINAGGNIELFTKRVLNIDAEDRIVLNGGYLFLGMDKDKLPDSPAIKGKQMFKLMLSLLNALGEFASLLSTAVATAEGSPITDITSASEALFSQIDNVTNNLSSILSTKVFISNE